MSKKHKGENKNVKDREQQETAGGGGGYPTAPLPMSSLVLGRSKWALILVKYGE
jgi:hypothetical protein